MCGSMISWWLLNGEKLRSIQRSLPQGPIIQLVSAELVLLMAWWSSLEVEEQMGNLLVIPGDLGNIETTDLIGWELLTGVLLQSLQKDINIGLFLSAPCFLLLVEGATMLAKFQVSMYMIQRLRIGINSQASTDLDILVSWQKRIYMFMEALLKRIQQFQQKACWRLT